MIGWLRRWRTRRVLAKLGLSPEWYKMTEEEAARVRDDWRPKILTIASVCGISESQAVEYYRMAIEAIRATQERKDREKSHEAWLEENRRRHEEHQRELEETRAYQERAMKIMGKAEQQIDDDGEDWKRE